MHRESVAGAIGLLAVVLAVTSGCSSGSGGTGEAGLTIGGAVCQSVAALDRSCTAATDCFAAVHQTNCCGQRAFIGLRTSVQAQYQTLEPECKATYRKCLCAEEPPITDDGSTVRFDVTPTVACLQGVCTTLGGSAAGGQAGAGGAGGQSGSAGGAPL